MTFLLPEQAFTVLELRAPEEGEATTATAEPAKAPQAAAPTGNPVSSGVDVTHTAEFVAPGFKLVLYTSAIDAAWDARIATARFLASLGSQEIEIAGRGDCDEEEFALIVEMARTIHQAKAANDNAQEYSKQFIGEDEPDEAV